MDVRYSKLIEWYYRNHKDKMDLLVRSLSHKQIECKKWLVQELSNNNCEFFDTVFLLGGWFGFPLVQLLQESNISFNKINNCDFDDFATAVCWNYKTIFEYDNVHPMTHKVENKIHKMVHSRNLIINTSSEHMINIPDMIDVSSINPDAIFVFQSNDLFDEPDHINCVEDVDELVFNQQLSNVIYTGSLKFDNYTRFMAIGSYK